MSVKLLYKDKVVLSARGLGLQTSNRTLCFFFLQLTGTSPALLAQWVCLMAVWGTLTSQSVWSTLTSPAYDCCLMSIKYNYEKKMIMKLGAAQDWGSGWERLQGDVFVWLT